MADRVDVVVQDGVGRGVGLGVGVLRKGCDEEVGLVDVVRGPDVGRGLGRPEARRAVRGHVPERPELDLLAGAEVGRGEDPREADLAAADNTINTIKEMNTINTINGMNTINTINTINRMNTSIRPAQSENPGEADFATLDAVKRPRHRNCWAVTHERKPAAKMTTRRLATSRKTAPGLGCASDTETCGRKRAQASPGPAHRECVYSMQVSMS